ncbi:MAG: T9SS type A sorting domain-containing protein [Bacteroidia bacterium]|nr:T9SS type A sorting domain-containing protein [Bacteroidia bacterium]
MKQLIRYAGAWCAVLLMLGATAVYAQPANDALCNAAPLTLGAACTTGDNTGATVQPSEPDPACFFGPVVNNTVWYSFVAPASGLVDVSTDFPGGSNDDTQIAIYSLSTACSDLTGLTLIACDDDAGTGFLSFIDNAPVTPGQTYYIQVDGWTNTVGTFCIQVLEAQPPVPPANDALCNATLLTLDADCSGVPNGTTVNGTAQANEPLPGCFSDAALTRSVWFKFVAPLSGQVSISTDYPIGTNNDTQVALYQLSGSCTTLSNLSLIACDDDGGAGFLSLIPSAPVTPGDTFYVQVDGWGTTTGTFCITVDSLPALPSASNDTLCNAVALTVGATCNGTPNGDNLNATFQIGEPSASCTQSNNSVWYSFVAPASGFVNITTNVNVSGTNSATDIVLYGLPGGNCATPADLFEIDCSNGASGFGSSLDTVSVTPGATYYVRVVGGTGGTFCIQVSEVTGVTAPANDILCNATPITVGADCTTPNGNNTNAGQQISEPLGSCFSGNNTIWYSFVAPASGFVNVTTDINVAGLTLDDTHIAVYSLAASCAGLDSLVELDCDDDGGTTVNFNSVISTLPVTPGQTYYVQVAGFANSEGAFCIEVEEAFLAVNDDVCDAIALPVDGTTGFYYNNGATVQPGEGAIAPPLGDGFGNQAWNEDNINNSVWFTFVAPASGAVDIDLCNGGGVTLFDTQFAVYAADTCTNFASFVLQGANDEAPGTCPIAGGSSQWASQATIYCLTPGETYYLLVDGFETGPNTAEEGTFGITLTAAPIPPLNAGVFAVEPECPGESSGFVAVSVTGGGGTYTYNWSNGATTPSIANVPAGTYTVTIQDQCDSTLTLSVQLKAPDALSANAGEDQTFCVGGTAVLGSSEPASGGLPFESNRAFGVDLGRDALYRMGVRTPEQSDSVTSYANTNLFGGDLAFGVLFALDNTANNQRLVAIDTATGALSVVGPCVAPTGHTWTGLAFDETTATLYASSSSGGVGLLYTVDISTGAPTIVDTMDNNIPIWIAVDTAGVMYTMDIGTDALYLVDKATAATTFIGPIGFNASFAQDADFDPETNKLYMAAYNTSLTPARAELRLVDVNTGASVVVGPFTGLIEVDAFAIAPNAAVPYTYNWTPAFALDNPFVTNPTTFTPVTTTYVMSVLDACGTVATDTVVVTVGTPFALAGSSTPDNGTSNGTATVAVTGGTPPFSFLWSNGSTNDTITGLANGDYIVTVTDAAGCTGKDTVLVRSNVGIEDLAGLGISKLQVFPNPTTGLVNVQVSLLRAEALGLSIHDLRGQQVLSRQGQASISFDETLDLSRLAKGVYMLRVQTSQGVAYQRITLH